MPLLLLSSSILLPAITALLTLALPRRAIGARVGLSLLAAAGAFALLLIHAWRFGFAAGPVGTDWMPDLRLDWFLMPDRLGLFFALLISGIGVLIVLYTRAYFGPDPQSLYRFYPMLLLFMTAMLGLVLSDNFILLLLFWELTSISSFLLIGWERQDGIAVKKALQAFIVTGAGGLFLMGGLILLGLVSGVWRFSALTEISLTGSPYLTASLVLIFAGAAAKSAQWPLHFWLPGAMAAPTPVSAYLHSATMVKAGVYLVGRLWPILAGIAPLMPLWPGLIASIGGLTMVLGAYIALRKSDLKQVFAYTTVSQLGLLMCMYGLSAFRYHGHPNVVWEIAQILNHALYKAPLFLLTGAIAHIVHTRELPELRGLARCGGQRAIMAFGLILAAYAMAAGPLTLSFTAKEFFFYGIYHAKEAIHPPFFWILAGAGVLTGAFNTAIFFRLTRVLLGRPDPEHLGDGMPPGEAHPAMYTAHHPGQLAERISIEDMDEDPHDGGLWATMLWAPAMFLLVWQFLGGIVPGVYEALFGGIEVSRFYFDRFPLLWNMHAGMPLYMSLTGFALGAAIAFAPLARDVISDQHDRLFPAFYDLLVKGGARVFRIFQTGSLTTYLAITIGLTVLLVAFFAAHVPGYLQLPGKLALDDVRLIPAALGCAMLAGAGLLLAIVRDRTTRVLVLGTAGAAITVVFYLYAAPDLALTQISIEIVSLILFLLVLALLPPEVGPRPRGIALRLAIAVPAGAAMFWLTLMASTAQQPQRAGLQADGKPLATLGEFFLRNSYVARDLVGMNPAEVYGGVVDRGPGHATSFGAQVPPELEHASHDPSRAHLHKGGGGANVVNVILVDFRGFDTLGEITVLGLAALGVWTLLRRPPTDADEPPAPDDPATLTAADVPAAIDARTSTMILEQATKFLVPLALVFSAFVFFKGHQSPGGGFVGGLVAAVALIVYRMCFGAEALRRLLPVRERTLIALGLAFAAGTGAAALLAGLPFMTSNNGFLPLGRGESFEWATVMFFDAGVYLVVVGVTVGMIDALSQELDL